MTKDPLKTVDDLIERIDRKEEELSSLVRALRRSLLIQSILPDAFAFGSCKIGSSSTVHLPHKGTITFRRGDDSVIEMPAIDVPIELWPLQMQYDFEQLPLMRQKTIQRIMNRVQAQR